ncbi:MAG: hypothetical protein AAF351_02945 [Pseudomonadota bacterium]
MILSLLLLSAVATADESKTVLGSNNQALKEGADALQFGDAEEGIRLTLLGLRRANTARERQTAHSNLCAGYVLVEQYQDALVSCNKVLAENESHWRARSNRALVYIKLKDYERAEADLAIAETISPQSRSVRGVRRMLLDAVNPVAPNVVIDERRQPAHSNEN